MNPPPSLPAAPSAAPTAAAPGPALANAFAPSSPPVPARPPHFARLGWRMLWRELRAGELRLLVVAIALAVAALSAVGFFADRLQAGLARDARQLLGGDVVIASDQPPAPALQAQAEAWGLQANLNLSFPTMARADPSQGGATRLVALKAVAPGYPLRGQLQVAQELSAPGTPTLAIPTPGEAWADAAVLQALGLRLGDVLWLGDVRLRLTRLILQEPDRGAGFLNFAPRVLMHQADLAASGLVQPASRIGYRLAVVARPDASPGLPAGLPDAATRLRRYSDWVEAQIRQQAWRGVRLESLETGRPEMRQTLNRADQFLRLVALLAALLSAVAVALAARGYAQRRLDACALLRVLGLRQRDLAGLYGVVFGGAGAMACLLGLGLGFALHHVFVWLLAGLVSQALPPPGLWPALLSVGVGMTLMLAFGLPPVLQLAQVPALRVLRRDLGTPRALSLWVLGLGLAGYAALLVSVSPDGPLGLIAVGGFAGAALLFAALAWLALRLLRLLVNPQTAPRGWVLATRQVLARPAYAVLQISALSLGLLALILLVLLRTDLVRSWQQASPADANNRFVINVQADQAEAFLRALREAGVAHPDWYPMFRGRLVAVNGRPIGPEDYVEARAQRLVEREFNLSHSAEAPAHNRVVAGRWQAQEADALSMEEGIAKTLGLKLGDRLRFDVAGQDLEARITSLRKVEWGSMRANFFVMFPTAKPGNWPLSYLAAFRAPADPGFDQRLVQAFPNITSVDLGSTLGQVQQVLKQVIQAVEWLFGFTLAAGLLVLLAALGATREERARELAIMRALGASAQLLRQVQQAELLGLGLLAGFLASVAAGALGWLLARQVFEFDWALPLWLPLAGAAAGAALAWLAGWWGLRAVLQHPVMQTLREAVNP